MLLGGLERDLVEETGLATPGLGLDEHQAAVGAGGAVEGVDALGDVGHHRRRRLVAPVGILGQQPLHDAVDGPGHGDTQGPQVWGRGVQVVAEHLPHAVAAERGTGRQALEEHDAEGVEVRPGVDAHPDQPARLRRQVAGGADGPSTPWSAGATRS